MINLVADPLPRVSKPQHHCRILMAAESAVEGHDPVSDGSASQTCLSAFLRCSHCITPDSSGAGAKVSGRGTYKLVKEVWRWLHDELGLEDEAEKVALAFVLPNGEHAYA